MKNACVVPIRCTNMTGLHCHLGGWCEHDDYDSANIPDGCVNSQGQEEMKMIVYAEKRFARLKRDDTGYVL